MSFTVEKVKKGEKWFYVLKSSDGEVLEWNAQDLCLLNHALLDLTELYGMKPSGLRAIMMVERAREARTHHRNTVGFPLASNTSSDSFSPRCVIRSLVQLV